MSVRRDLSLAVLVEVAAAAAVGLYTGHGLSNKANRIAQAEERIAMALETEARAAPIVKRDGHPTNPSSLHQRQSKCESGIDGLPIREGADGHYEDCLSDAEIHAYAISKWETSQPCEKGFHLVRTSYGFSCNDDAHSPPTLPTLGGTARDVDCRDRNGVPQACQ